jgi:hypothetical protein
MYGGVHMRPFLLRADLYGAGTFASVGLRRSPNLRWRHGAFLPARLLEEK